MLLLGIYPDKTIIRKDTCTPMFTAALFTIFTNIVNIYNSQQPTQMSIDRKNCTCCTYTQWYIQFSSAQSLSPVQLFATPWIAARQASLSITNSQSSPKLMSIESVMPSSHLILCHPLLLLPPILPSIRVFSNESTLRMRWPKYWSFSFSISPSKEITGLISFRMDGWISLQSKGLSRGFSNTTVQKHQFFGTQPSSQSNSHIHTWPLEKP